MHVSEVAPNLLVLDWLLPCAGTVTLDVQLGERSVQGSPFSVAVVPALADATRSWCHGVGLQRPAAGELAKFVAYVADQLGHLRVKGGDRVKCRIDGAVPLKSVRVHDHDDSRYTVTYTPRKVGAYQVRVWTTPQQSGPLEPPSHWSRVNSGQ